MYCTLSLSAVWAALYCCTVFEYSHFHLTLLASGTCYISALDTLRPRQNGRYFPDNSFLNVYVWISINISLKFVPRGPINDIPTLVQGMAWRRPGDKPLSEPMMVTLPTHICFTRPQWVNIHIREIRAKVIYNASPHSVFARVIWFCMLSFLCVGNILFPHDMAKLLSCEWWYYEALMCTYADHLSFF